MDRKVRPLIFLVSDREFHALQDVVRKSELSRSEILRRALRMALPILSQVGFTGTLNQTHELIEPEGL